MQGRAGTLHVDDGGQGGVPVVIVPSLAGTAAQWDAQLRHLRASRRAMAVELRGHGRSELRDGEPATLAALVEDLEGVVESLELPRYVLVGHSLGGAVAVAHAARHPDRVAGVFLVDPSSDGRHVPPEAARGLLDALASEAYTHVIEGYWRAMLEHSSDAVRDRVLRDLHATAPRVVRGALEDLLSFDPEAALARYTGPRFALVTRLNDVPGAYHRLAGIRHEFLDGVGHWAQLDAPALVSSHLAAFLDQVEARP